MYNIRRIPFTELFERLKNELMRDSTSDSTTENKYKSRINDIYMYSLPGEIDYRHIRKTGTITSVADYTTGTIALTNASTTVTGTTTVWTSANSNNLLLKANNYNEIYRVTYVSATSLTLDRNWVEDTDTSESYTLYQDRYALASDFSRMILNPDRCVYYYRSGHKVYLDYRTPEEFEDEQTHVVGTPNWYTVKWVGTAPYLYIDPPDTEARTIRYEYIPALLALNEYTTGTITTLANAGTAVTGSSTVWNNTDNVDVTNYEQYFRIDADGTGSASQWYDISSIGSDTTLTLSSNYRGSSISSGTSAYTIARISLLPPGLDLAILYGAAIASAADQESTQLATWGTLYTSALSPYKVVENTRDYGKQRIRTIYENPGVRR